MRKLTLLISMLFLSLGMAWAQSSEEVKVTDLNDLDDEQLYFIESERAFLMYNTTANANGISTSTSTKLSSPARSFADPNYWFQIKTVGGNRYLYSVAAGKYITKNGGFSDNAVDALGIVAATSDGGADNKNYHWKLTIGGNGMNSQVSGQMDAGITVNWWTSNDKGNCYRIISVAPLPFEYFDSYENVTTWYKLGIRDDNQGPSYLKYDATKEYIPTPGSVTEDEKENFAWAFIFIPGQGMSIVNCAAGSGKVLSAPVKPTADKDAGQLARMVEEKEAAGNLAWNIIMPTTHDSPRANTFYVKHPSAGRYFNRQGYNNENALCYWTGLDAGSSLWFEALDGDGKALKNAVAEVNTLFTQKPKGNGVGKYSSSYENYEEVFAGISDYASSLADNAISAEIRAKIEIVNAIKGGYALNMPEAGNYYTFSNGDNYITSNVANDRIACAPKDAYAIYYYDGTHLKSFTTGRYIGLNKDDWTFSDTGSTITFQAAANNAISKYNINSGNRWLHLSTDNGNYVNRCSNNTCGDAHNWVIEEVTELPVAQIGNTVYYTLADAKANVKAGETLTLFVDTDETIELPLGVTLDKNGHTADNVTVATPVAKIGEQGYATLAAAVKAASAGATITFVADVNEKVTLSKNVTIDGANFNYTGTMSANNALTVTVQNVHFVNGGFSKNNDGTSGTYTIKDCTFDGQGKYAYPVLAKNIGTLNVENCTVKDYQYGFLYVKKQSTKVSVKNVTVENCPNYAVYFASGVTATIEGLTVKNSNNGILWPSAGARKLKLSGCKFENVKTAINSNGGAYVVTANVQGVNNDFGTAVLSDNVKCVLAEDATLAATTAGLNVTTNVEGKEVAYKDGAYSVVEKFYAAKVGAQKYETLAAAVEAAEAGATVELLNDVAASDIITINKAITLDGNGKTLTSTAGRAINVDCAGNVGIKNLTIDAKGQRAINIIDKAATVELNDVTATASNNAVMIATSAGAANVTINGCDFTGLAVVNVAGAGAQVAINDTKITNIDANKAENYGAITVYSTATNAKVTVNGGSITVADDSKKAYIFAEGAEVIGVDQIGQIVAMIGEAGYETLTKAIADAKEGQTVKMVYDVTLSEILVVNKAITLDGNGKTLTYTGSNRAIEMPNVADADYDVTIKNLNVAFSGSYSERGINYNDNGTLTLEKVIVNAEGKNVTYALNLPGSSDNATVVINESSLTGNIALNVWGENAQIDATDSHFTSVDKTEVENYAAVKLNNDGSTIAEGTIINIKGGSITAKDQNDEPSTAVSNATATGKVNVSTETAVVGEVMIPVAIVTYGGSQFYSCATLQAAIDKAIETKGTVELLTDITASDIITVNGSVVIDGKGHTLTSTATRAINIDANGVVTIKNLTVVASGERAFNVINKAATLNIENVTATAANYTVNVATSAGAAKVNISGSTLTGLNVVNVAAPGAEVTINGGTIVCNDQIDAESYAALALNRYAVGAKIAATDVTFDIKGDSGKASNQAKDGTVTINGSTEGVETHVAYIDYGNNTWYGFTTIEAAIAKAQPGETVALLRDVKASAIITINKAITLDGNGKTLTSTAGRAINVSGADGVTIKNLIINASGERAINVIQGATNVTIDNVTATAANYTVNVASSAPNAVVAIKGSTLNGLCTVNVSAAGAKVTVDNSTVNCNDNNTTAGESYAALCLNKEAVGGSIVATNTTVNVAEGSDSMKGRNGAENGTVTINGSTDGVAVMVAVITYEGSPYYHSFASLAKAVEFAKAGETVKLLRDATGAGVVINKSITIDFNGKTYTANAGVGSAGTQTLALQILKGNDVTLKNGTLTSEGENIKMLINNYANLTVDNMKLVDATDAIQYVLSNNCGTVNIVNGSVITANGAIALDACKYASYAAPTVNVAEGVTVNGNVEVSATLNMNGTLNGAIVINGAEGVVNGAEGLTVTAMDGYNVAYAGGVYTVVEKQYVAQVGEANKYETFAEAVTAAPAGATVTLINNATEDAAVILTKNLKIDGAGHTFTGAIEFKKSNGSFTVKNVNFNGPGNSDRVYALKSQSSTTSLTVEGCTATGYPYGFLFANSAIANVTVTDVTVTDVTYGVHSARGTNVTLNNFVANNVEYGVMVQNYSGRNVVLNNCTFEGCETPLHVWKRDGYENKITFNFQGVNEMGKDEFCTSDYAVVNADAVVGTKVCGTLAEAVEAAQAGETVTLLRNVELSTFLTINKSITLNMGEYNITRDGGTALYVNGDVEIVINGTTGTVTGSQALWVANGLAKVNGGNFHGVAEAVYVQNTGKAEIYDGTFSSSNYNSFVLNKKDDSRETAFITVYGGTFVGFNPANNAAEGKGTNFVAAGLMAVDNGDGTFGIAKANIKMGDSYYATLAEAIAAIGSGDVVIELLADATLDYNAREAYGTAETTSVKINGNGNTLTLNQTNSDWSSFGLAAGKVAFNDMTIEKTGHGDTNGAWNKHAIIFSSPVEMNNVTVNNAVAVQAGATLNNVTINEAGEYYGLWINGNGQTVTINGGAINATNAGRGIKIADQYIDAPAQVTLNVTGTVFSTAKKAAVLVSSKAGAQITADNVDITNVAEDTVNFVWVDEDWSQYFAEVEVEGATKDQEGIENLVAQRSNGASYKTLAAAVEAAAAGETITLIGNTEEDVTVSKNLTIEGASKQYTGVMTLNKVNVTVQNLNFVKGQISKSKNYNGGNVTIVSCNFDGQGMNSYAVNVARTGSVVIENVTAQNYGYGFLQLSHSNNKLSIKNVKVQNTNYALKIDYSNGVTIDGLKVDNVAIAAIYNSNYGTKTYTITNSDFSGAVEAIKMWERNTTVYDTFVFAGGNTLGDATLSTSPYAIYKGVVAEVGTKKYLDLRVAFDAAQDGETVKMLDNVTLDTKTLATQNDGYAAIINVAGKAVTLDLNGKNITVDAAAADLAAAKGKMLLTVFHADTNGELTLTDNTADKAGAVVVNVNDATVYSVFASESQYSDKSESGKLTVNAGNYKTVGKIANAMFFTDANEVITVNGGNFHCDGATTNAPYPWMFNTLGNNELHVTVNGGTFNVDVNHQHRPFEVYVPETFAVNANGDGTWTVVPAVAYITEKLGDTVHESGDLEHKVGYTTLAAAVEAAVEGDYVTLLKSVTGEGLVINKGLTIDFGGNTYSFNEGVGSTGTASNGFQILKGNDVTLKNGKLRVADEAADKFYILVQNYADYLTVENMTLDGTNLDKWSKTDGDSYVLSNNSGEVVITGNTNITANNEGDKAFAFDACDKTAWGYTLPEVNVETTGKIAGLIESTATIAISGGTFTAEILPEWCAEYYAPVQNADGTWTVDYRYIDEKTIVDGDYTEFVNEKEMTVGTLTYERDFTGFEGWQTLFVPFEIPVEELTKCGYEVAYFFDVHYSETEDGMITENIKSVHFVKITQGRLRANFPYVIKRTSGAEPLLSVTLYDAKLYSTAASELNTVESSSTTTRFVFAGTYKKMGRVALTGDDNTPCYRFTPKGQVQMMSATANLVPFRVCMYIKTKDNAPVILDTTNAPAYIQMRVIGESDDETTDIKFYDLDEEQSVDYIYDLQGRRVLEPQKGGLYIVNGKKIVF